MLFHHFKKTIPLFLLIALLISSLSACHKKADPLAKSGFTALTIDKKNRINAEITLDSRDLQAYAGQAIFLYELSPDEELSALAKKDPLDSAKLSPSVTLSTDLNDGERTRLYSRFYAVFSDGTLLSTDGFWIENPQAVAKNQAQFPWSHSQKGLSASDPDLAIELGSMHTMLYTSVAELTQDTAESFLFGGVAYPISHDALTKLDKQVLEATEAGMQVSLTLTLGADTPRGQAIALIDLLAARYSTDTHGTVTALFLDADESFKISDVALLCRVANAAFRSRVANARVYVLSDFLTVTETKAFFSNLRIQLSLGGKLDWGAAIRPLLSETPWEKDTGDRMAINRLGELSQFLFFETNHSRASWLAVCGISFPADTPERQAVAFAYTYREAIAATATLVYYDVTGAETDLYDENGTKRRIASVFTNIDTKLSQEDELLCQKTVGEAWAKKIADLDSRKQLTGIASVGSVGFEEKPLFEVSESDPHSFTAISGTAPTVLRSAAWNAPVLSTWIDSEAIARG